MSKTGVKENLEEQLLVTRGIMEILDGWGLSADEIIFVLALPEKTPSRAMRKYRETAPFPFNDEIEERVGHIIGIADAIRTSYPHNPQMGKIWLRQSSKKLNNRIPLKVILEKGLEGLLEIRTHLDCSYDWEQNP